MDFFLISADLSKPMLPGWNDRKLSKRILKKNANKKATCSSRAVILLTDAVLYTPDSTNLTSHISIMIASYTVYLQNYILSPWSKNTQAIVTTCSTCCCCFGYIVSEVGWKYFHRCYRWSESANHNHLHRHRADIGIQLHPQGASFASWNAVQHGDTTCCRLFLKDYTQYTGTSWSYIPCHPCMQQSSKT